MNILHLNDKITISGGVEVYIQQLLELSTNYSLKVFWLGIDKTNGNYNVKSSSAEYEEQTKITFSELIQYLKEFISKNTIDIIHIHSISNPKLIEACFKLAPVVRSMHEPRIVCPGHGKFWRKSEEICSIPFGLHCIFHAYKEGCCNRHPKRLLKAYSNTAFEVSKGNLKYKAIIAMSNYMQTEAIKVGYSKSKIILNPYFTPHIKEEDLIDASHNNTKSLLFVGRLSRTKGVHYLIEVGILLLNKNMDIVIDIIGDGHDAEYIKSLVPEHLKDKIKFHGWKSHFDVHQMMLNCYLLIFPSIYPEAFGISGIEAMMRAKPAVGFDVGGVSTWLKNEETGFLVPVKNISKMTNKIMLLLNDPVLYKKMSCHSRTIALNEFCEERHMKKLINIYKGTL